jgi:hypothetical protein
MSEVILLIILKTHPETQNRWGCFDQHTFPFSSREMKILQSGNNDESDEWMTTWSKWNRHLQVWQNEGRLNYLYQPTMEICGHEKVTIHIINTRRVEESFLTSKL